MPRSAPTRPARRALQRGQNWIGGTCQGNAAFVPPPAEDVLECMSELERFLHHQPEPTSVLLKAALTPHYTIGFF